MYLELSQTHHERKVTSMQTVTPSVKTSSWRMAAGMLSIQEGDPGVHHSSVCSPKHQVARSCLEAACFCRGLCCPWGKTGAPGQRCFAALQAMKEQNDMSGSRIGPASPGGCAARGARRARQATAAARSLMWCRREGPSGAPRRQGSASPAPQRSPLRYQAGFLAANLHVNIPLRAVQKIMYQASPHVNLTC